MGSLYLRGKTWWAKYYEDGRPVRRSCGTEVKRAAKTMLDEWGGKVARGELTHPAAARLRFEDLKAALTLDYTTNKRRSLDKLEDRLPHLARSFAHRRLVTITTSDIQEHIAKRQAQGAANATINRELAALKRGFNLLLQAERLTRRPYIPMLAEENARTGFIGPLEALALREALAGDLQPLFDFLYETGWRKQEALGLPWTQVDLTAGIVRLTPAQSKNKKGREIHLTAGLLETLRGLWLEALERTRKQEPDCTLRRAAELSPCVFTRNGKPILDFRRGWEKACKTAKLPGLLVHDLRRSAIRRMIRAGVSQATAMEITGHKTASVFQRYNITSATDRAEAARKLEGASRGATGTVSGTIEAQRGVEQIG